MVQNTTPVPNALFDVYLKDLKSAELKVLLVIIRQTLGWADRQGVLGRKERDWISSGQLQAKTGSSRRAISSATEILVKKELIEVLGDSGNPLNDPIQRKGKLRLYYRPSHALFLPVDKIGENDVYTLVSRSTDAEIAEDLCKKRAALAQKMRITKETLQN